MVLQGSQEQNLCLCAWSKHRCRMWLNNNAYHDMMPFMSFFFAENIVCVVSRSHLDSFEKAFVTFGFHVVFIIAL